MRSSGGVRGVDCRTLDASCLAMRMARYIAWVSNTKEVVLYGDWTSSSI